MAQEELTGGRTPAEIEKMRKQHGTLLLVSTTDAEGLSLYFWFKKPDMKVMGAVTKLAATDPLMSNVVLFKNTLINQENVGHVDDVEVMMAVMPHLETLVKARAAEVRTF